MGSVVGEVQNIWKSLRKTGHCDGITITPEIRESWSRSEKYGVDPYKRYCDVIVSPEELKERRHRNSFLMEQAAVMMSHLNQFVEGTDFVFALADRDLVILSRVGGQGGLDFANLANFVEGADWSEKVMGTTPAAIALILKKPVQFIGYESFCRVATFGCGCASPIFDSEGEILGFLTVAGPQHLFNPHTLGMAEAAARAIEHQMALLDSCQQSEMANLHKTTIMESMSEGVLTLDRNHRITHINMIAGRVLGIDSAKSEGKALENLMPPGNEHFLSKLFSSKRLSAEPLLIRKKGKLEKLAVSSTALIGQNGRILGTVVILQPMKQYKQLIERVSGARANVTFDQIIGQSREFTSALSYAQKAADSDSNVLLLGESGVGKDLFAQAIHNASDRSKEPFFAINCAALPKELISSELFGYEDGAFTGARKGGNPGKFELADQGTVFLDEIGEMPLDMQASLLRLLEEGTVVRLGGKEVIPVNVRIIAASNKNLLEEVKNGNFRLDLYYRLGVMDIRIPPLRNRKDDIPGLVTHFIKSIGPKLGKSVLGVDDKAMALLLNYDWPGNVRELSNAIERAINLSSKTLLTADDFSLEIGKQTQAVPASMDFRTTKMNMEDQLIRTCLLKHNNNRVKAAEELGINRATLYRKMAKYSIK
ncbi:sigma-54-dependent Fis family transcriptional regulator [Desulfatitalea tepidiphila]|uniref:sigma-54-dependent Fis family transcriptional regulator n=1 Tax=Desulfatitalea tepidiphila TaxID=1185843 RepID=UPI0006B4F4B2|nr:sigma 54-interacting transcriptional regulator [Desulfatitalea tepidiphila]